MSNGEQTELNGLWLFKSLVKDGCQWQGDVVSRKWSEMLVVPDGDVMQKVKETVKGYTEGVDYKIVGYSVWVA